MQQVLQMRDVITEWFETDFKQSAQATTKTSRLPDGRLSYSFSVENTSGFDFDKFSFRIKVINKADGSEIGTASIKAGEWAGGEVKNFKSRLAIPENVRSISFVMYANSLDFEARPNDSFSEAFRDMGEMVREVGEALSGTDGSGGVFGELFGTGGMPETTTTKTTSTTTKRKSDSDTVDASPVNSRGNAGYNRNRNGTFSQKRNEKKLNKKRLGRSAWTVSFLVLGIMFVLLLFADSTTASEIIEYASMGGIFLGASGIMKLVLSNRAKRIRAYEARVNYSGNTSIDELAAAVGRPYEKTCDELQQMIVDGFFGEAYVDIDNRLLVMTRNGKPVQDVARSAAENKKARRRSGADDKTPETVEDLIAITDDKEIKGKLKELAAITKKIDERVEQVPDLEKQVKDFREKYYPEVVRLTDEYNEKIQDMGKYGSEKKEVESDAKGTPVINTNPNYLAEQAEEIKKELVVLIDSVTEASENLLEKLHEDDIMDITTDIKKLQTTLANKGLLDSDFDIR